MFMQLSFITAASKENNSRTLRATTVVVVITKIFSKNYIKLQKIAESKGFLVDIQKILGRVLKLYIQSDFLDINK